MYRFMILAGPLLALAAPLHGEPSVTVAQLEQFLHNHQPTRLSDAAIAGKLTAVKLAEQLTAPTLARLQNVEL